MTSNSNGPSESKGSVIRKSAPQRANRFPRHTRFSEIEKMPRLQFSKGCESGIFISRERDEARFYSQGLCFHDADMEDLVWDETSWDEAFYCIKGQLRVLVSDIEGNEAEFVVEEGDHFWAPAGYKYTMKATGVESINFWTMAPLMQSGWRYTGDDATYSDALIDMRAVSEADH
jgi:hypothetical protein